ncbi:glycine--tRNA ligase subunit beta [Mesotoga sp. H07.pep.5.3]|jgi:glycyl-tRNA synthetase beta chain|uniref:glycine--tRNA ligase subunit beta n=2 Tax=unclassified Mesotoga TaxID=1184398 RepID=UPI000C17AA48|nr:glycine--tRNA ligase subunit beta [Mesotoga sp. H07.pep.5.3]MDK2944076.1 glycyl-tRNA synthetase beta chain [Mesotoga sp.]PIJ62369.1 glycyl-tRNA synthetase subunit beta [Mesotoga sp. H07.pep.5.3]
MSDHKALLEVGIEELPSSEVTGIRDQLNDKIGEALENYHLRFDRLEVFVASRRFGVLIHGIDGKQADFLEQRKGPSEKIAYKDGVPTKALLGFLRGSNAKLEDVIVKDGYVYIEREITGETAEALLPQIFSDSLKSMDFKKPMRWGDGIYRFVRPVRWIVAMLDSKTLEMELFRKKSSNKSRGHRFFFDEVEVSPCNYFEKLSEALVIARESDREERVLSEIRRIESNLQSKIPVDKELVAEVVSLTEYPSAVLGRFLEKYLQLPPEVIIVTIKHHQRTFPVDKDGKLTNNFVAFQDGPDDPMGNIRLGYEEVINARLEDAFFYFIKDKEKPFEAYVNALEGIMFQRGLGSLKDKTDRTVKLSTEISRMLGANNDELLEVQRTALLAKADQTTRVVQEFPELQGIMGRIYALDSKESHDVAMGIEEHYLDGSIPTTLTGAVVGVADRLDTLVGNFMIGNIPSASKDPYALRRKASFIFRTMHHLGWKISLDSLISKAMENLGTISKESVELIQDFFSSRFEAFLIEKGFSINVSRSVNKWWNVPYLGVRAAEAIKEYIKKEDFNNLLIAYQRVHNISKNHLENIFDGSKFVEQAERDLLNDYLRCYDDVMDALERDNFEKSLELLTSLKPQIDRYFDDVFVMADQEDIRLNRLGFLKSLDLLFLKIGDLSLLLEEERT